MFFLRFSRPQIRGPGGSPCWGLKTTHLTLEPLNAAFITLKQGPAHFLPPKPSTAPTATGSRLSRPGIPIFKIDSHLIILVIIRLHSLQNNQNKNRKVARKLQKTRSPFSVPGPGAQSLEHVGCRPVGKLRAGPLCSLPLPLPRCSLWPGALPATLSPPHLQALTKHPSSHTRLSSLASPARELPQLQGSGPPRFQPHTLLVSTAYLRAAPPARFTGTCPCWIPRPHS